MQVQWWLAVMPPYGCPDLSDGPHSSRAGVEKAAYLTRQLGLSRGKTHVCVRVEITAVEASGSDVDEAAVAVLNGIGLRP